MSARADDDRRRTRRDLRATGAAGTEKQVDAVLAFAGKVFAGGHIDALGYRISSGGLERFNIHDARPVSAHVTVVYDDGHYEMSSMVRGPGQRLVIDLDGDPTHEENRHG